MGRGGRKAATAAAVAPLIKDPARYKTELCATFSRAGTCPYGHKCQFAHGVEELRVRQDQPSSYKTKACRSFARTGRCPYGPRCRFMHGDVREAQHLAALRLADEGVTSPEFGPTFGTLPPPMSGGSLPGSSSSSGTGGIADDHLLAQLLGRHADGPAANDPVADLPGLPPPQPPSQSHGVLLPHAQLPQADVSKQLGGGAPPPNNNAWPPLQSSSHMAAFPAAQQQMHLSQPIGSLGSSSRHPSASPSGGSSLMHAANSPSSTLMPSTGSSLLSSALPSTHNSAAPSPAAIAVSLGSITSPPPQHLAMLPPAILAGGQLTPSGMQQHSLPPQALPPQQQQQQQQQQQIFGVPTSGSTYDAFGASLHATFGACGDSACSNGGRRPSGFGSAVQHAPCYCGSGASGGDTSASSSSGRGSCISDILQDADSRQSAAVSTNYTAANTNFTRSSIAKQLSVLFDDGGSSAQNLTLLGRAESDSDVTQSNTSASDEGRVPSPLSSLDSKNGTVDAMIAAERAISMAPAAAGPLEGSLRLNIDVSDSLVDQLAAVCCSPPRHETGSHPWRTSPTAAWH